ncbi:glycosyltransferase family 4 protein [Chloroflexus sp.]|uniref:glycosyltransferase family 4 protein n=1 Tax=Chloroflexus sp. TaxID=1904827 RepID=UPI0026210E30|nr:glycosyltransferase family 4 protein [uncultured Chloroflexus sp.]
MRILIIGLGGVSRHFRNWPERALGQALVAAGHDVMALTYWQPDQPHLGLTERSEVIDGIHVRRVRPQLWPGRETIATLSSWPLPDVAHVIHPRNVLALQAVRWLRRRGVPVVWTWLGPYHDRWLVDDRERPYESRARPEKLIYSLPQLIGRGLRDGRWRDHWRNYAIHHPLREVTEFIPCSQHEAEVLRSLGFRQPMTVVPLWLDMAFMEGPAPPLEWSFTPPIIPYIGQLTPRKGYDLLVSAMPAIIARYPQASFVFVTHNPAQRAELQRLAGELGVTANLHFLGTLSEEQKLALLRASAVLPFPSRYEGFGLPVLEGMAVGVPVVSTNIPVINELICDGEDGLLVPYNDAAALAQAILRLLDDQALRSRIIAGGWRAIAERFAPQRLVEQVISVYRRVARRI